ncbi:P-loop containing nucleoside triphosphate hydrolase protein [Phaeosphaeriaceae sp. PMI808]|nr:P-loop containing nucleoside triphosphate hydrolase protein [Phaeosphaeriaceae sp. PMI808]
MSSAISFGDANRGFQAGIIHGPVNTTFQLPLERLETPPCPSAVIPFGRDTDFVEREIFDQIQAKCAAPGSRTALVGLGGVGKSQLAIELAYRIRERSPEKWVFWVHASNAARFEQSLRDIANCVKVPGRQNPNADIFQLVHDWLQDEGKRRWFLILDNVDDAGFLLEARSAGRSGETGSSQPLISYVPRRQNGSVLITTRSRNAALRLVEQRDIIPVEPMEKRDALTLLQKKLGQQENSEEVTELAAALEYMPLAMAQAAAYISQRRPRYSVQRYLGDFRMSDRKRTTLLDYEGGQLHRDWEAKNSIIITWQISFDYIRQTRPSAGDLLALMSFYDRQGIPDTLLRDHPEEETARQDQNERDGSYQVWEDEGASQSSASDDKFEDDILTLRDYSFISVNADGATFEMHGLVQLATRKWLEVHDRLEQWKQRFVSNLCAAFPTGDYENWAVCQALFPHAKSAAAQRPEREDSLRDWASLLYKAAWYALKIGNGVEAELMSLHSMRTRKKILGQNHKYTLQSIAMVGNAYRLRGRWDAAEELEVQVMEMSKKKLGADHPDMLTSMANLASTYWNQGRWDAAEELEVQVIETSKKKLGVGHPSTLTGMANLASTYQNQGQ